MGLNSIGLKRRGFSSETIRSLKEGFKQIFRAGQRLEDAIESLSEQPEKTPELENFLRFIKKSQRGIAR